MKLMLVPTVPGANAEVSVTVPSDDLALGDVIEQVVRPALLAWGFAEKNVDEALRDE